MLGDKATLIHGDCLNVLPKLDKVNMILADPPYGTTRNKWDSVIPLEEMWRALSFVRNDRTPVILYTAQPFTSAVVSSNFKEFGYDLVWRKSRPVGFLNANRMPLRNHENIVVFYRKLPLYNPQKTKGKPYFAKRIGSSENYGKLKNCYYQMNSNGDRFPVSVLDYPSVGAGGLHPTQKPVPLMEYFIKTFTNPGDTVLDFTMGSGSTGVACIKNDRKFIGVELDAGYFRICVNRIGTELFKCDN